MKNIKRFENFESSNPILEERKYIEVPLIADEMIQIINKMKQEVDDQTMTENRMQVLGFLKSLLKLIEEEDLTKEDFERYSKGFVETMKQHFGWYNPNWLTKKLGLDILSGKSRKHYDPTAEY